MLRTDEYMLLPDFVRGAAELKAKKTCCRSGCLNCPYDYTVKEFGLQFKKPSYQDFATIKKYLGIDISQTYSDYELLVLKGYLIGAIKVDKLFVREMFLHKLVDEENISKELVESYYFY